MGVPRFAEVEEAANHVADVAIEKQVDAFLFLGDLTDPDSEGATSKAQALAIRIARRLDANRIINIWIAGNHDAHEDGTGATTLTPLAALANGADYQPGSYIYVAEEPKLIYLGPKIAVLCLPFMPTSHGVDLDIKVRELWPHDGTKVIVLSHLSVPGVMPGEETTEMPRGREIGYPFDATKEAFMRLQGHYHRRQDFDPEDGGPPIIIPGSLARLTFGEEDHTPSYLLVEI